MECIFCDIVAGKMPTSMVYEDEAVVAFADLHPKAETHVLVVPRVHVADLLSADDSKLLGEVQLGIAQVVKKLGVGSAYRVVANGGIFQEIKHLHYHVLAGDRVRNFMGEGGNGG